MRSLLPQGRDEFLELAIPDALITRLSALGRVALRPTSAISRYAGATDPVAAGRELRVEAVLDGTLQKTGDAMRVSVRLLRVADGQALWAGAFDEKLTGLLALEDALAERVSRALLVHLSETDVKVLVRHSTGNPEAHRLYLQGRYFANRRTSEGLSKALESFRQAAAADPGYAQAYAGMADSWMFLRDLYVIHREGGDKGRAAAQRALELDPNLAEAHATLGLIAWNFDLDWPRVEQELRLAIRLNPSYPTAHHWLGEFLAYMGRFEEATVELGRARDLDPLSAIIATNTGTVYFFARDYERAIEWCRKALDLDPNFFTAYVWLSAAYAMKGMYPEAIEANRRARAIDEGWIAIPQTAAIYALWGKTSQARAALCELEDRARTGHVPPVSFFVAYAALDEDQAFAWLERSYENRDAGLSALAYNPLFDRLRRDPRFQVWLARLHLPH